MQNFDEMFNEGLNILDATINYIGEIITNVLFVVVTSPIWLVGAISRLLTKRAADWWESARLTSIFHTRSESCFQTLSASCPPAANANRWADPSATKGNHVKEN